MSFRINNNWSHQKDEQFLSESRKAKDKIVDKMRIKSCRVVILIK